ncbi:MAG: hypothetical protein PHI63_01645 [Patescibacteria group bacterium]|nr:hypothetical protein [Patescibacteria group bacterium]
MGRYFFRTARRNFPHPSTEQVPQRQRRLRRWCATVILFVVVACASYLAQANTIAAKGFEMEQLRQKINQLRTENRDLENQALQLQSLQHLSKKIDGLNLVPAENISYVSGQAGALSLR